MSIAIDYFTFSFHPCITTKKVVLHMKFGNEKSSETTFFSYLFGV